MRGTLRALNGAASRHAGKLLLTGLLGVAAWNWRLWQRDKARLAALEEPEPLVPLGEWPALPRVSVLVAAWNEADMIEAHVESFLALRYPQKELVLCAGGVDGTYNLAQRYAGPGVIVLEQRPGEGKQRALRRCFERASGEVIYLTDADCLVDDEAFERTVSRVCDGTAVAVSGRSKPFSWQLASALVGYQWSVEQSEALRAPEASTGLLGRNCAIRTEVLKEVRAFEVAAETGTDYVLARQLLMAGYTIKHARHSRIGTLYPDRIPAYFSSRSRWLRNLILIGFRTGDTPHVLHGLRTVAVGMGLLLTPLLVLVAGRVALAIWILALSQGALARARYVSSHGMHGPRPRWRVVAVGVLALGLDALVWAGALIQCLSPSRRWSWD